MYSRICVGALIFSTLYDFVSLTVVADYTHSHQSRTGDLSMRVHRGRSTYFICRVHMPLYALAE